ncbi:exodeoxyribonuclease iii [Nannochloropsis oceanica]
MPKRKQEEERETNGQEQEQEGNELSEEKEGVLMKKQEGNREEEQQQLEESDADQHERPQKKAAKMKAAEVVLQTKRCALARNPALGHPCSFKVLSWNVNGLNGILNGKHATLNGNKTTNVLQELVALEGDVDVLFLQETKLQESKCSGFSKILPGYVAYWSCSKVKKGYSGVAAFVKEVYVRGNGDGGGDAKMGPIGKQRTLSSFFRAGFKKKGTATEEGAKGAETSPCDAATADTASSTSTSSFEVLNVKYGYCGDKDEDEEGRVVTLEFACFWLVGVYVANSGMRLERLQHRLKTFNPRFQEFLSGLNDTKPVLVIGDFNVAPLDIDCYNAGAKHLVKVPGLTPEEREAHATWLGTGWKDTFRAFHPEAKGQYTYWNVKTNARPDNKGLRLDFAIIASQDLEGGRGVKVHDSFILHEATVGYSDHAPIGVVLEVEGGGREEMSS